MPIFTPFYGPGSHKFCGNISHLYPDKSLNASAFLESVHSTAQWTVFCLTGWIWGLFGDGHLRRESAPNFCPRTTKLGGIIWVTQKSILMDQYTGSHKEIWINCQFWVLLIFFKNGLQIYGTPKNCRFQPKIPVLIQRLFETQTAQYIEPKNTPEINKKTYLKWFKNTFICDSLFGSPCDNSVICNKN